MAKRDDNSGWIIATALQALPAVIILVGLPFTPGWFSWSFGTQVTRTNRSDSPRWLVSKDRSDDALKVLRRLRRNQDVAEGLCEYELAGIQEDIQKCGQKAKKKGGWLELFNRKNRRRTG